MNSHLLEVWIVLPALETIWCVLLILSCYVARDSRYTAGFLLCALKDDLHPVSFCFLCHNSKN